jgi:hypothetical protein
MVQAPLPGSGSGRGKSEVDKEAIRARLRRVGLACLGVGLVMVVIGLVDALIADERSRIWMILAGIPLAAVGGRMLQLSNLRPKR